MSDSPNRPKSTKEVKRLANDMARLGQVISERYELLELLGHGGMGAVYKARHLSMDRLVAVKFLLSEVADDPLMRSRFLREATASGKIKHPNVVELIDYGEGPEGDAYIVIEFLDGIGLDQIIKKERQIEYTRAVNIFEQICSGVAKAHAAGIIHRDLKPSNVMIVEEHGAKDFVKIVDFGLAKALGEESQRLTMSGEVFGSPIYMAPEQCLGQQLGPSADIYALGVLMYESLMGRVPFLGSNVAETIARQMQEIPRTFAEMRPDLQIPASLEAVVMKALAKDPEQRQSSMLELKEELSDAMLPRLQPRKRTASVEMPMPANVNLKTGNEVRKKFSKAIAGSMPPPAVPVKLLGFSLVGLSLLLAIGLAFGLNMKQSNKIDAPLKGPAATNQTTAAVQTKTTLHFPVDNPVHKHEHARTVAQSQHETPALKIKIESKPHSSYREEAIKIHKAHLSLPQHEKKASADIDLQASEQSRKHHRDWHDFTSSYEKKESYTHSWSVPLAGSKSAPEQ